MMGSNLIWSRWSVRFPLVLIFSLLGIWMIKFSAIANLKGHVSVDIEVGFGSKSSFNLPDLDVRSGNVIEGSTNISGVKVKFMFLDRPSYHRSEGMIIGVFSDNEERRNSVRQTWGAHPVHKVYFLVEAVNGVWPQTEFLQYGDIVVVDRHYFYTKGAKSKKGKEKKENVPALVVMKERDLPMLAQAFFCIAHKYMNFRRLLIANDDSVLALDSLNLLLEGGDDGNEHTNRDFWGYAKSRKSPERDPSRDDYVSVDDYPEGFMYPEYPDNSAYAISKRALDCIVDKLEDFKYLPEQEVATAVLMQLCKIELFDEGKVEVVVDTSLRVRKNVQDTTFKPGRRSYVKKCSTCAENELLGRREVATKTMQKLQKGFV
eukprot:CFRG0081T1